MTLTRPKKATLKVVGQIKAGHEFDLADALGEIEKLHPKLNITLDISECTRVNSAALGVILASHKRLQEKKLRVRIYRPQKEVAALLELTRLNRVFHVTDSDEEET